MTIIQVSSFKDIPISRNTLVLCDIDDTVIVFDKLGKKWWRERFDYYYDLNDDFMFSEEAVLKEWIKKIHKEEPKYVDENGFLDFIDRINDTGSTLVFITARPHHLRDLTMKHLKHVGIMPKTDIHYTDKVPKGEYISNVLDFDDFDHVIFIDDMEHNLKSVERIFENSVVLYEFCV